MQSANRFALKEWASVCAAIAAGRQTVLLRKGGIDEGPGGFHVQHSEFWLYPTRFHQSAAELRPAAAEFLAHPAVAPPAAGAVSLRIYAVVTRVVQIVDVNQLDAYRERHVLSGSAVAERFGYRQPGLFAIEFDAFEQSVPHHVPELPAFAGCHSWVDLGCDLPTGGLSPIDVLD